jgi:hypothetical protein
MPDAPARGVRKLWIGALSLAALFFAGALLLDLAYAFNGSLELFPTAEQQGKIRTISMLAGIALALAEGATLFLLGRFCLCARRARNPGVPKP